MSTKYPYDRSYRHDLFQALARSPAAETLRSAAAGVKTIEAVDALLELAVKIVGDKSDDAERWVEERLVFYREPLHSDI